MTTSDEDKRRAADADDLPPSGDEANAQRKATSMPLIWLVIGLVLIAAFAMLLAQGGGLFHAKASGAAPPRVPSASGA